MTDWNRFSPDGFHAGVEVIGTGGRAHVSVSGDRFFMMRNNRTVIETFEGAYRRSIESFIEAVCLDEPPTPSLEDAVRASEIAFAARRSFESGGELTEVTRLDDPHSPDAASNEARGSTT